MKNYLWILVVLVLFSFQGSAYAYSLYAENEYLELFMKEETAEFYVAEKGTERRWYSNPINRQREEVVARGAAKDALGAQIGISYYTPGDIRRFMDSFNDSVKLEQFEIIPLPLGVRVEYSLGVKWKELDFLPGIIRESDLEELLEGLSAMDRKLFTDSYVPVVLVPFTEEMTRTEIARIDKETVFPNVTLHSSARISKRDLLQLVATQLIAYREDLTDRQDIKAEHVEFFSEPSYVLRSNLRAWDIEEMVDILRDRGFDPERLTELYAYNGLTPPKANPVTFFVAVEYRLEGRDFVVTVPLDAVEYPKEVLDGTKTTSYPLHSLDILPYFEAAGVTDTGYLFVPDGSGAIIEFNHGKTRYSSLDLAVYGRDFALSPQLERPRLGEIAHLPVYGMNHGDKGFLAVMEKGEASGRILADIAGRTNSYNTVSNRFMVIPMATTSLSGSLVDRSINVYQARANDHVLQVRYLLLGPEEADYSGMARRYREYLVNKHDLMPMQSSSPLLLQFIGAVPKLQPVLGIPKRVLSVATSFQEAKEVVWELQAQGIHTKVLYSGWQKGGLDPNYPMRIAVERVLGGAVGLKELQALLGPDLYLEHNVQTLWQSGLFDGFTPTRDGARFLNRQTAKVFTYHLATFARSPNREAYLISPRRYQALGESIALFHKETTAKVALDTVGRMLYADYRSKERDLIPRVQAQVLLEELLHSLGKSRDLLVRGSNAYVLPFASTLLDVPMESSKMNIVSYDIPFLPMVLSGYYDYATRPLNLSPDPEEAFLKGIEAGFVPYFLLSYAPSPIVKDTDFDHYLSIHYSEWKDRILEFEARYRGVYEGLRGVSIRQHERIALGVTKTLYENGTAILVNYNSYPVETSYGVVRARSYLIEEGKI